MSIECKEYLGLSRAGKKPGIRDMKSIWPGSVRNLMEYLCLFHLSLRKKWKKEPKMILRERKEGSRLVIYWIIEIITFYFVKLRGLKFVSSPPGSSCE